MLISCNAFYLKDTVSMSHFLRYKTGKDPGHTCFWDQRTFQQWSDRMILLERPGDHELPGGHGQRVLLCVCTVEWVQGAVVRVYRRKERETLWWYCGVRVRCLLNHWLTALHGITVTGPSSTSSPPGTHLTLLPSYISGMAKRGDTQGRALPLI